MLASPLPTNTCTECWHSGTGVQLWCEAADYEFNAINLPVDQYGMALLYAHGVEGRRWGCQASQRARSQKSERGLYSGVVGRLERGCYVANSAAEYAEVETGIWQA